LLEAVLYRLQFIRLMLLSLSLLAVSPAGDEGPSAAIDFRPSLDECAVHIKFAHLLLHKIRSTVHLGLQPPNSRDDEDYGWLPSFEPDVNRRQLPATFPRKTKMKSRLEGIECFEKLCLKILSITTEMPSKLTNIEDIIDFLRTYSLTDSCVLSRSLLQLVLFPRDDRLMGRTPLSSVIIESIRLFAAPAILDPTSTALTDEQCRTCWNEFVNDSVKVFLSVIQMFGQNLARQREKIINCIEDFSALHTEESSASLSLTSFVLLHTLSLIRYHFYLSFYLDLFAPFEYPYVYWYLGGVVLKWLVNTFDRSVTLIAAGEKRSIAFKTFHFSTALFYFLYSLTVTSTK
uniref:Protein MAK10 homolog n=1 Tax=Gongylonema pulchrum TaxID=637853 RepID=A0A183DXC6_9BILA